MARKADYYSAHEAARLLGLSPDRVRRMLRCGQIEGERGPGVAGAVAGAWGQGPAPKEERRRPA